MRPQTQAQTGVGSTNGIVTDYYISPFNIGFGVVVSGTVNYTVQHTFDGTNWFNHPDIASQTANADGNYAFPVIQVRLTVNSGSGTATITVIQAGLVGG
mgnify:FL=1|jgi:hypothetical protein